MPPDAAQPKLLECSVITSSSCLPLESVFRHVRSVHSLDLFDLLILRKQDLDALVVRGLIGARDASAAAVLADESLLPDLTAWIRSQCAGVRVAALASYYPGITSLSSSRREQAVKALVNTIKIAMTLSEGNGSRAPILTYPVVEMVCGSLLDPTPCDSSTCAPREETTVYVSTVESKLERLCQSLMEVHRSLPGKRFFLALEVEPGDTYVLRNEASLRMLFWMIDERYPVLNEIVGINADLAHLRLAEITPEFLDEPAHRDRLIHSHVCDHPGAHTRDQIVGTWTPVYAEENEILKYLRVLKRRAGEAPPPPELPPPGRLPFTRTVALELEGCGRMAWLDASVCAIQHLISRV